MSDPFDEIFDMFNRDIKARNTQMELAAIWLEKAVVCKSGKTCRIAPGEEIRIENGLIVDILDKPTHSVIMCMGTMTSKNLELTVMNIETNELSILHFK